MKGPLGLSMGVWGTIAAFTTRRIIGMFWYSPTGFGKRWRERVHVTMPVPIPTKWMIFTDQTGAVLMSFVLALIAHNVGATTVGDGAIMGFAVWLGFIAPVTLSACLRQRQPLALFVYDNCYELLTLLIMSVLVSVWHH